MIRSKSSLFAAALAAASCSSTIRVDDFVAAPLGHDPYVVPAGAVFAGVPVRARKPFRVRVVQRDRAASAAPTPVPGAAPTAPPTTKWSVVLDKVATLPDPDHIYAVNFASGTFSNEEFELKLFPDGTFDSAKLKTSGQAAAALAEVAAQTKVVSDAAIDLRKAQREVDDARAKEDQQHETDSRQHQTDAQAALVAYDTAHKSALDAKATWEGEKAATGEDRSDTKITQAYNAFVFAARTANRAADKAHLPRPFAEFGG